MSPAPRVVRSSRRSAGDTPMKTVVTRPVRKIVIGVAVVSISLGVPPTAHALHPKLSIIDGLATALDADKAASFTWVDRNAEAMKALGTELWGTPELSFREFKSSR